MRLNWQAVRPFFNVVFMFVCLFALLFVCLGFMSYDTGIDFAAFSPNQWLAGLGRAVIIYVVVIGCTLVGSLISQV
jgi:hypothetical protein